MNGLPKLRVKYTKSALIRDATRRAARLGVAWGLILKGEAAQEKRVCMLV